MPLLPLLPRHHKGENKSGSVPAGFVVLIVFAIALLVFGPGLAASYANRRRKASQPPNNRQQAYEKLAKVTHRTPASPSNLDDGKASEEDFELASIEVSCPFCLGSLLVVTEQFTSSQSPPPFPILSPQDPAKKNSTSTTNEKAQEASSTPTQRKLSKFIWRFLFSKRLSSSGMICTSTSENSHDTLTLNTCGHSFHASCLMDWILRGKEDCPICRVRIFNHHSSKT